MAGLKTYPTVGPNVDPATVAGPFGGYLCHKDAVSFHEKLPVTALKVRNTGDRPVQVGSHFHFFEVNRALEFDRAAAFGMHLDIPAGTAVRFEPGEAKEVTLATFGGTGELHGLNSLTDGSTTNELSKEAALRLARERGFKGA